MAPMKVAVLLGGSSAEREVSLKSGAMVLENLDSSKYEAIPLDPAYAGLTMGNDLPEQLAEGSQSVAASVWKPDQALELLRTQVEVAFIALHGRGGEDGSIQGLLELVGVPYTGSGVLASALALDKILAKKIFQREGIPTAQFLSFHRLQAAGESELAKMEQAVLDELGLPAVVKPATQGSTLGVTIVKDRDELRPALELAWTYDGRLLVEPFLPGMEVAAGILGNDDPQVLPLVEIVPAGGVYDYHAKYTPGATDEIVPARINEKQAEQAESAALADHLALGCRGMSRVDMIVTEEEVFVLEINTIPGLTETSLLPRAAQAAGIEFPQLLDRLLQLALQADRAGDGLPTPDRAP